jgi:hypothetical protein
MPRARPRRTCPDTMVAPGSSGRSRRRHAASPASVGDADSRAQGATDGHGLGNRGGGAAGRLPDELGRPMTLISQPRSCDPLTVSRGGTEDLSARISQPVRCMTPHGHRDDVRGATVPGERDGAGRTVSHPAPPWPRYAKRMRRQRAVPLTTSRRRVHHHRRLYCLTIPNAGTQHSCWQARWVHW